MAADLAIKHRSELSLRIGVLAVGMLGLILAAITTFEGPTPMAIEPQRTDPRIRTFLSPHLIYINPDVPKRNQMFVFLPGTNGRPGASSSLFCQTAADVGYHVIVLAYPTDIPAARVRDESDPGAFGNFRREITEGQDLSPFVAVGPADSIENRLTKAVAYMSRIRPQEGWDQFLSGNGDLNWAKIAVGGHSQGGGHAAYIATRHRVARVVMTGAPKDYSRTLNRPAAWYTPSATPAGAFFAFNHQLDRQGCPLPELRENERALGMYQFGDPVNVDQVAAPFRHARILETNFAGSPTDSLSAHSTVIGERLTPRGKDGTPVFRPVWVYMLTEPVTNGK